MDRNDKKAWIADLSAGVKDAETLVLADYRGLSVADMTELRNQAREAGVAIKVIKNRLARLAFKGTDFEGITPQLEGTKLIAYAEDVVAPAKVLQAFAKGNDKLTLVAGVMNATLLDEAGVKNLASMPSLYELRGKLVGLIQAPAGKIAQVVNAPAGAVARCLGEFSRKAA